MKKFSINFNYLTLALIPFGILLTDTISGIFYVLGFLYAFKAFVLFFLALAFKIFQIVISRAEKNDLSEESKADLQQTKENLKIHSYSKFFKFFVLSLLQVVLSYQGLSATGDYQLLLLGLLAGYFVIDTIK